MMWFTISNRFLLGVVVAMTGFITVHLMCNLKLSAWLRGIIGFLVSLSMAIGALMGEDVEMAKQGF
jgi:hypothetical protein